MMNKLRNIHIKRYTRFINSVASHLSEKESVIGPSATIAFPKFAKADSPRSSTHAADWDNDRESIHENISIDKPDLNSAGWFFRELPWTLNDYFSLEITRELDLVNWTGANIPDISSDHSNNYISGKSKTAKMFFSGLSWDGINTTPLQGDFLDLDEHRLKVVSAGLQSSGITSDIMNGMKSSAWDFSHLLPWNWSGYTNWSTVRVSLERLMLKLSW